MAETIAQPGTNMYRVRRWGDKALKGGALSVAKVGTTNFQAIGLYNNGSNDFGAVANFIHIPREDIDRLKALQVDDVYMNKHKDWRAQKMDWICHLKDPFICSKIRTILGKCAKDSMGNLAWAATGSGDGPSEWIQGSGIEGLEGVEK